MTINLAEGWKYTIIVFFYDIFVNENLLSLTVLVKIIEFFSIFNKMILEWFNAWH